MAPEGGKSEINIRMPYLQLIADGVKTVEVRVGYPRMRAIRAGQELTFLSGDRMVVTRVKRVTECCSVRWNFEAGQLPRCRGRGLRFGRRSAGRNSGQTQAMAGLPVRRR